MVLAVGSIVAAIFRTIFALLDSIVYMLVTMMYNLFTDIASINLFGADGVGEFGTRIYTIIGVIMLFKLAFSILTYIIDPDKMTDNKNGFGTIVKDIVIMFVLIVTVPLIFRTAMGLQYLVLEDDTIGRLVTGHHGGDYKSMGERLSSSVLLTFIHPNEDYFGDCAGIMSKDDELYNSCVQSLAPYPDVQAQFKQIYEDETNGRQNILKLGKMTDKVNGYADDFVVTYHILLSTGVGLFVAYVLLVFCIDIATRTVKLAFLQLIAPIPIVAYMDEKGKSGMFKKWVDTCRNTYLDLFIRLAGIDFAMYLIAEFIYNSHPRICHWKLEGTALKAYDCRYTGLFTTLFLILGVLIFAKQLPNIIKEITGIDLGGKFQLNPMKKIQDESLFGKQISAGLGLAGRSAKNLAMAGGIAAGGVARGLKYGTAGAIVNKNARWEGFKNNFASGSSAAFSRASSRVSTIGADAQGVVGDLVPFIKGSQDKELATMKNVTTAITNSENRALEKIKNGEAGKLSKEYNRRQAYIEALKGKDTSGMDDTQLAEHTRKIAEAQYNFDNWYNNDAKNAYIDLNNGLTTDLRNPDTNTSYTVEDVFGKYDNDGNLIKISKDATLENFQSDYNQGISVGGFEHMATAEDQHSQLGKMKGRTNEINRERMAAQEAKSGK